MYKLEEPLNSNERYLHGVSLRLEILIDLVSSLVEVYASNNNIVTENITVEEITMEVIESETIKPLEIDYSQFTNSELKAFLDTKNIEYTSNMRKMELIELLK